MDVVRAFYGALNAGDAAAIEALHHPDCVVEHGASVSAPAIQGREAALIAWRDEIAGTDGALPGAQRIEVTRIAGIETGWGWVRAEWYQLRQRRSDRAVVANAGYSHFWIEDGLIRRHRIMSRTVEPAQERHAQLPSERRYPTRPLVGVGAVILSASGEVLLVKRRHEPLAGQGSLPGGKLELGETLEAGVAREIEEETGLVVTVGPVVEVFDRILLDDEAKVRYHFVLIDYLCDVRSGTLRAGSDVEAVQFVEPSRVDGIVATEKARDVVKKALAMRVQSARCD